MKITETLKQRKCPKCGSEHVDWAMEQGVKCLICMTCGYDETEELNIAPEYDEEKYKGMKTGGPRRTQK